jgi:hypothetical protein
MSDKFDSLAFSTDLIKGGFSREQAEAIASAMFRLMDSQLVTKDYLDLRLSQFKAELKAEILQWVFGAMLIQSGLVVGLVKLL